MENNTELEYPAEWLPYCYGIENMLKIRKFQICLIFQIVLIAAILIGILILVRQYIRCKIVLHGNLLLLFANMIFLYFLNVSAIIAMNLRYMILFSSYEHPCQLLTPVWLIPFFVAPNYLYTAAFPAFHFFIMIERYRATVLVEKYEKEGRKFDIKTALLIWTFSIGYMIYVILSAFADIQAFNHPQSMPTLTSQYNAKVNLYVNISMPPIIVLTAFCDWRISVMNRRKKNNSKQYHFGHYNLSQNYQLKENELTMRLILPLDISYACIYSLYQALIIIIRAYQPVIPKNDFTFYYIMANNIIYIYIAVAIIVYIQFVRHLNKRKRRLVLKENKIVPADQQINKTQTDIYFKQLKEQWA